jgi:hypothetical protein
MDYTKLSLAQLRTELGDIAHDTQVTFGSLDEPRLNWRADDTRWSVAQCFEHLVTSNQLMIRAAREALNPAAPRSLWQRLPLLPDLWGHLLIRTQGPTSARKFVAPGPARPTLSRIGADIIPRFVDQHRQAVLWLETLDERDLARAIMTSPFARPVTYRVLDGCRIVVAHDRRHFEQARRVMLSPEFPRT